MGTNYYLHKPLRNVCEHCGRHDKPEKIHLGKSSSGWCFSLHVYPDTNLFDWPEIRTWLEQQLLTGSVIKDEYSEQVSLEKFESIVTERYQKKEFDWDTEWWCPKKIGTITLPGYTSEDHFHESNHSARGPYGLLRHRVDQIHCISNGFGTWDCIIGEFS